MIHYITIFFCFLLFPIAILAEKTEYNLPQNTLILDAVVANDFMWIVGQHGSIFNSSDGIEWKHSKVNISRLLTTIDSDQNGRLIVAGHDANILLSKDVGDSWQLVYSDIDSEQAVFDIAFIDNERAIAIGSYGLYLISDDRGETWRRTDISIINAVADTENIGIEPSELHFNALLINQDKDFLAIAAESGFIFLSDKTAQNWEVIKSPYAGSFFGGEFINDEWIVFYGIQGTIYLFNTQNKKWKKIQSTTKEILHSSFVDENNIYFIGYGSTVLKLNKDTNNLTRETIKTNKNYTSLIKFKNKLYLTSDQGIEFFK